MWNSVSVFYSLLLLLSSSSSSDIIRVDHTSFSSSFQSLCFPLSESAWGHVIVPYIYFYHHHPLCLLATMLTTASILINIYDVQIQEPVIHIGNQLP